LELADLNDVESALWDARAKWRSIGSCIGVDEGTLDTMKGKDDGENLNGVLSHWLKGVYNPKEKNSKPRTWHTLIEALRNKVVNEAAMAKKLDKEKSLDTNQGTYSVHVITWAFCDRKGTILNVFYGQFSNSLKAYSHSYLHELLSYHIIPSKARFLLGLRVS
jgi:hypothetical protein